MAQYWMRDSLSGAPRTKVGRMPTHAHAHAPCGAVAVAVAVELGDHNTQHHNDQIFLFQVPQNIY